VIIVDTSVWIDYFNGEVNAHTDLLDRMLSSERIAIGDIILAEVLHGFRRDADFRKALELFEALEFKEMLGRQMALRCAQNYRKLRRAGVTARKTIDVMIATFCVVNGHVLVHDDRDFEPMEKYLGLKVLKP